MTWLNGFTWDVKILCVYRKKDGKPLETDGKKYKITIENDDSVSLLIEKMKQEDAGKYSCEIKNSHGSASSSNNVAVSGIYKFS